MDRSSRHTYTDAEQLPRADLKSARLINKQRSAVTATVIWSKVELNLTKTDDANLENLLRSYPNGILDNVNDLAIAPRSIHPPSSDAQGCAVSNLLKLLIALTRDSLVGFRSVDFCLNRDTLALLLRTQSQLRTLTLSLHETEQSGLPGPAHIRDKLKSLRELKLIGAGVIHHTHGSLHAWFPHMPCLRSLSIGGRCTDSNYFNGWTLQAGMSPLRLHSLELYKMVLSRVASGTFETLLDLSTLESLKSGIASQLGLWLSHL